MIFGRSDYDTMLQIVPSAGFSPPSTRDYSADYAVDNFDLSVLPGAMDNENPFANNQSAPGHNGNHNVQQFLSLYYDMNSPPPLFPMYENAVTKDVPMNDHSFKDTAARAYDNSNCYTKTDTYFHDKADDFANANTTWNFKDARNDFSEKLFRDAKGADHSNVQRSAAFLDMEMVDWEGKHDWDNIRVRENVPSVTSSSNCSSPDFQLCPSTPPDFDTLIPLEDIKQEITVNLQNLLNDDGKATSASAAEKSNFEQTVYDKKPELLRSILEKSPLNESSRKRTLDKSKAFDNDHKLIRQILKDTSFQKKYNLRPVDIQGLGTGYQDKIKTEEQKCNSGATTAAACNTSTSTLKEDVCDVNLTEGIIAPILSKAIEQLMQDVDNTSIMLGIPRDPKQWSAEDVRGWLLWNSRQHNLPISADLFNITGAALISMSEEDFQQRAPQCGSLLFAQLEIWKVNSMEDTHVDVNNLLCDNNAQSTSSIDISDDDDDDDEDMADVSPTFSPTAPSGIKVTGRGSGSHIHLWQFLKELLSSPQAHGSCIRWLDRSKGVFKIEDSVRVARLWGKRKNRPAMNYDKLSRSIRQYYKKGIMKKTERSQRLVYQFCTPYNL